MESHDRAGWIAGILVFALIAGVFLSNNSLFYDKVEIVPGISAVYELVPGTPVQIFGELLFATAVCTIIATVIGSFIRQEKINN